MSLCGDSVPWYDCQLVLSEGDKDITNYRGRGYEALVFGPTLLSLMSKLRNIHRDSGAFAGFFAILVHFHMGM